jgi:hypothetical protein
MRWLTRLWSAQAKVEGIVLKAAWHWDSDSNVVNDPLGEPGRTPLYVCLPSAWDSVDGDRMFSPSFMGALLNWELRELWQIEHTIASGNGASLSLWAPLGEPGGGVRLPETIERKMKLCSGN